MVRLATKGSVRAPGAAKIHALTNHLPFSQQRDATFDKAVVLTKQMQTQNCCQGSQAIGLFVKAFALSGKPHDPGAPCQARKEQPINNPNPKFTVKPSTTHTAERQSARKKSSARITHGARAWKKKKYIQDVNKPIKRLCNFPQLEILALPCRYKTIIDNETIKSFSKLTQLFTRCFITESELNTLKVGFAIRGVKWHDNCLSMHEFDELTSTSNQKKTLSWHIEANNL